MPDELAGRYVSPTLLRARDDAAPLIHELEVFGPVATIVTYRDAAEAFALASKGGGSLAISVFSDDAAFLAGAARAVAPSHGRVMLVDASVATTHTGHGIVLPSLIHGGPGRAGGGEELGGLRGLSFYTQWSAVQGPAHVLASIAGLAASVRS
jgi:3,4-dehydroadipyl-CoA semialdehyde dehydrogenase